VGAVFGAFVDHLLVQECVAAAQARSAIDGVHDEAEAVHVVEDQHVERGRLGAFLLEPEHVQVRVTELRHTLAPSMTPPTSARRRSMAMAAIGGRPASVVMKADSE
jgi:hypothetical protein